MENNNITTTNSKLDSDEPKSVATATAAEEQNPNSPAAEDPNPNSNQAPPRQSSRTPFANLSQVDADLALARTLQEQVRHLFVWRFRFWFSGVWVGIWVESFCLNLDGDCGWFCGFLIWNWVLVLLLIVSFLFVGDLCVLLVVWLPGKCRKNEGNLESWIFGLVWTWKNWIMWSGLACWWECFFRQLLFKMRNLAMKISVLF